MTPDDLLISVFLGHGYEEEPPADHISMAVQCCPFNSMGDSILWAVQLKGQFNSAQWAMIRSMHLMFNPTSYRTSLSHIKSHVAEKVRRTESSIINRMELNLAY